MRTPASIKGHPLHPMLIALPVGLLVFSVVCDVLFRVSGGRGWDITAFFTLGGGILSGLIAAVPGLIDWLSITDPVAKRLGKFHMLANVSALGVFLGSFYVRWRANGPSQTAFVLSVIALLALSVGGWLGGSLVYKHRVAVSERS